MSALQQPTTHVQMMYLEARVLNCNPFSFIVSGNRLFISNSWLDIEKTSLPRNSTRNGETSRYCKTATTLQTFRMCSLVSLESRRQPHLEENPRERERNFQMKASCSQIKWTSLKKKCNSEIKNMGDSRENLEPLGTDWTLLIANMSHYTRCKSKIINSWQKLTILTQK